MPTRTQIIVNKEKTFKMSESNIGVNSWLEDELYQQYLHNRAAVDESWKDVFTAESASVQVAVQPVAVQVAPPLPVVATATMVAEPPAEVPAVAPVTVPVPVDAAPVTPAVPSAVPAKVNGQGVATTQKALQVGPGEQLVPLRGAALKIDRKSVV